MRRPVRRLERQTGTGMMARLSSGGVHKDTHGDSHGNARAKRFGIEAVIGS